MALPLQQTEAEQVFTRKVKDFTESLNPTGERRTLTKGSSVNQIGSNTEELMAKLLGMIQTVARQKASGRSKLNATLESMEEKRNRNSLHETLLTGQPFITFFRW